MHSFLFHMKDTYCGIIIIRAGQYPLVAKIFLVRGDEVSLVASEYETYALFIPSWGCKFVGKGYQMKEWSTTNNDVSVI